MKLFSPQLLHIVSALIIPCLLLLTGCDRQTPAAGPKATSGEHAEAANAPPAADTPGVADGTATAVLDQTRQVAVAQTATAAITLTGQGFTEATLHEGTKAFSNRNYTWESIPPTLDGWQYTQTAGGTAPRINVKAEQASVIYIASQSGLPETALEGWEIVKDLQFAYNDRGHTRMIVYRHKMAKGDDLEIPQRTWSGSIVLRPPEGNPGAQAALDALASVSAGSVAEVAGAPPAAERIVQITAQDPREAGNGFITGSLLVREIQRQAISLAAREELGVRTRDMAMGDSFVPQDPGKITTLLVSTQMWRGFGTDVIIALPDGTPATEWTAFSQLDVPGYVNKSADKQLVKVHKNLYPKPWMDYALVIKDAEVESRGQFASALRKGNVLGGSRAKPSGWDGPGSVATEVETALATMDPVAQFAALRLLHAQIQASGESPAQIEALVRGYANLAMLTRLLEGGAYKTYMARGLLYAERLVVQEKSSSQSLYVRSYARGMAGLGRLALEDLEAARKQPGDAPWYAEIIDAWSHYDLPKMQQLAAKEGPGQELARMLAVAIVDDSYSSTMLMELGSACLEKQPENLWVMQTLFNTGQLSMTREMSERMRRALPALLARHAPLLKLPAELETLRAAAADERSDAAVTAFRRGLEAFSQTTAETGEPSLAALATIYRDAQFMSAYGQAKYLAIYLAAPPPAAGIFARQSEPAWRDHPMAGLLEALANQGGTHDAFRASIDKIHPVDAGAFLMDEYKARLPWRDYNDKWPYVLIAEGHQDLLPMDLTFPSIALVRVERDNFIQTLRDESPYAAFPALAWMTGVSQAKRQADQALVQRTIADMKQRFTGRPAILIQCAQWAVDINDYKQALALLEPLYRDSPSFDTARLLLHVYDLTGDLTKAKTLVDSTVSLPTGGLEYASVRSSYGEMLTRRFRYADALPYMQAAASSYSQWGLIGLASCEDGLGHFDQTSQIIQAVIERYNADQLRWYAWCKRVGHRDLPAATRAIDGYLASHPDDYWARVQRAVIEGKSDEAYALLSPHKGDLNGIVSYLNYVVVAAEAGENTEAQAMLKRAALEPDSQFKDVAIAMQAVAAGGKIDSALREFEFKMGPAVISHYMTAAYLGRFLAATGHQKEAVRYLKMPLMQVGSSSEESGIIYALLKKLGEDPTAIIDGLKNPPETKTLWGTWIVRQDAAPVDWTFDGDGTVTSSAGLHGHWWQWDGRILVAWTPGKWAEFSWPATGARISALGPEGNFEISRK